MIGQLPRCSQTVASRYWPLHGVASGASSLGGQHKFLCALKPNEELRCAFVLDCGLVFTRTALKLRQDLATYLTLHPLQFIDSSCRHLCRREYVFSYHFQGTIIAQVQ